MIKEHEYFQFISYIPKVLLAIIIPIFDDLYHKVAVWLNDMGEFMIIFEKCKILQRSSLSHILENYRSDESFEEHFVLKLILVSTVFKFPIKFSYLCLTEVFLSIYKEIANFNVTYGYYE